MDLFNKFGWLLFWIFAPVVAVGSALYIGEFKQRLVIAFALAITAVTTLTLLCNAMIHEYGPTPWFPASTATLHLVFGLIFAVCIGATLALSTGSRKSKTILGITAVLGWLVWWFITALLTACSMGDCL